MRAVLLVVVLTGCGRFGFGEDTPADGDAGVDGASPLATPQFCDDRVVTTLPIGPADAVAIRAAALDVDYAVAIETVEAAIPLLEIDSTGALVATHGPFTTGYAPLFGMSRHGDRPVVFLETGAVGYLKHVDPGWESYTTGVAGDPKMIDPAYVQLDPTSGIAARTTGGVLELGRVDQADLTTMIVSDYSPTSFESGSLTRVPAGVRVAVEQTGGVCETFVLTTGNETRDLHTFSPCYEPKVAAVDDTSGVIVHRTAAAGPYAIHLIPAAPAGAGSTLPLTGATYARVAARIDGAVWVGHGSGSHRALIRITPSGAMTESRENIASYAFDLTERDAFWIEGATVHVSTPCLR